MNRAITLIRALVLYGFPCFGQDYNQIWNKPTISHKSITPYFGMIGTFERKTTSDKIEIPAIPG